MAMGNDPVNSVDPDGGKDGPGDECPECAGWGAMLPSVEVSGEFTGSIGGSLEGLHFAGLTGTGYTSYDDAGNWYQTINRMQGNITYMYSNNEWSLYRDDARLNDAHLANVVSAADAVGKGTEFFVSGALGGFGGLLRNTSLRAVGTAAEGGVKLTVHGAERIAGAAATRGGVLSIEGVNATKSLGRAFTQADGASVFLHEVTPGRFNAVIQNQTTGKVITTMSNWSQKSINRIAKNYGWPIL